MSMSDMATAFVALTSIEKSSKHSNLIDSELINSILNNPEVTEKLDKDYGFKIMHNTKQGITSSK